MQLKSGLSASKSNRASNDLHYKVCGVGVHNTAGVCA